MKNIGTVLAVVLGLVVLPLGVFFLYREHQKAAVAEKAAQKAQEEAAARVAAASAPAQKGGGGGIDLGAIGGILSSGVSLFSSLFG